MRIIYTLILISNICFNLFAFEISGDPKSWNKDDFLGFDRVGDGAFSSGDISSVFARIEEGKLFFRITFDDMYSRKLKIDNFYNQKVPK